MLAARRLAGDLRNELGHALTLLGWSEVQRQQRALGLESQFARRCPSDAIASRSCLIDRLRFNSTCRPSSFPFHIRALNHVVNPNEASNAFSLTVASEWRSHLARITLALRNESGCS